MQVASLNTTIDAMLLAELGIQYNVSDSDADSDSGGGTVAASLTIDFVQRFNFSVAEDSTISFLSPQAGTQGYVPMLVFDNAGASTVLAESIFYNLKARPPSAALCANPRIARNELQPRTHVQWRLTRLCSAPRSAGTGAERPAHRARRCACATLPLALTDRLLHKRSEPFKAPRRIRGDRC